MGIAIRTITTLCLSAPLVALPLILSGCDSCTPASNDPITVTPKKNSPAKPNTLAGGDSVGDETTKAEGQAPVVDKEPIPRYEIPGTRKKRSQTLKNGVVETFSVIYDVGGTEVLDGPLRAEYPDGTLAEEANYEQGKLVGVRRTFLENAMLEREEEYNTDGELIRLKDCDYDMDAVEHISYLNGQKDGLYRRLSTDGTLQEEGYFDSGERDGTWIVYDERGMPSQVTNYKLGVKHGEEIFYDETGQVMSRVVYENGKAKD